MSSTQEVGEIFGKGTGPAHAMLRSPTVLIASICLWGMNIYFFRLFGINYAKVLQYDLLLLDSETEKEQQQQQQQQQQQSSSTNTPATTTTTTAEENANDEAALKEEHGPILMEPMASALSSALQRNSLTAPQHHIRKLTPANSIDTSSANLDATVFPEHLPILSPDDDKNGKSEYSSEEDDIYFDDDYEMEQSPQQQQQQHHYHDTITWRRLVGFSLLLLFVLHSTYYIWIDILGGKQLGAVFFFYGVVTAAIIMPFSSTRWLRKATVLVLQRSFELINPRCSCVSPDSSQGPRPVPFVDVFFADAMCSLSKVFFDWGMLLVMATHYPNPVPATMQSILVPSACAVVPFCIRARQCLIMYNLGRIKNDPKRYSHLWNALKYSTSIFPLCVSAFQKTLENHKQVKVLEQYLILLLVINALYALYWDIVMDWGMLQNPSAVLAATAATCSCSSCRPKCCCSTSVNSTLKPVRSKAPNSLRASTAPRAAPPLNCSHVLLRPTLRFGILMSAIIVIADCILRFSWTLRFYKRLFPSGDSFVLCTQFLEVFRRALWNLLRIDWENCKQQKLKAQAMVASPKCATSSSSNKETLANLTVRHLAPTVLADDAINQYHSSNSGHSHYNHHQYEMTNLITSKASSSVKLAPA